MSKSLIALVATAVIVNGERQIIQPGQPLPELKPDDQAALLAARAASEPQAAASASASAEPAAPAPVEAAEAAPATDPPPAPKPPRAKK